jgi:hypothetical protein
MNFLAPASALLLAFSGALEAAENSPPTEPKENPAAAKSIGMARMLEDGTILVGVPGPGSGDRAQAVLALRPGDTQYQPLLEHVGGLKAGETKPIPPWPDTPADPSEAPHPASSEGDGVSR